MKDLLECAKSNRLFMVLAGTTILTTFLALITFDYWDLDSMTAWTMNFWDLFFERRLNEFYEYTALNVHGAQHYNCEGNFLWLLPWCLWNLPLWLVTSWGGVILVNNFWSLCWSKLFLVLMELITIYFCGKICMFMTGNIKRAALAALLIMASPEIMMSVGYSGQDEMTYICFFSISLYYFLKGKQKSAYLWMVCAVTCCPLMLMPILAMLLIKEKNIFKLVSYVAGLVWPLFLFELFFRNDMTYQVAKTANDFTKMAWDMLGASTINTALGEISIAGFILVLVYFGCYNIKMDDSVECRKRVLYMVTVAFVAISFLMSNGFYRLFLYVPFLVIMILISEQDFHINMLLLMILTYGRALFACYRNCPDNMNTYCVMKNSWITALCDRFGSVKYYPENSSCLYHYLEGRAITPCLMILAATCVMACILILLIINCPSYKKRLCVQGGVKDSLSLVLYSMCTPILLIIFYIRLLS